MFREDSQEIHFSPHRLRTAVCIAALCKAIGPREQDSLTRIDRSDDGWGRAGRRPAGPKLESELTRLPPEPSRGVVWRQSRVAAAGAVRAPAQPSPTRAENQECGLLHAEHGPLFSSSVTSSTFRVSGRGQHWGPDEGNSSEAITRETEP
ncbi:unnamed protein product [Rangifer tarandus platyrhynchus]|uniref:Uncharacterized protein n=1 Tax=Rangifer tarandus platyrhynchus TaxID=3082113 RepID=A0AC59YWM3_RANTA